MTESQKVLKDAGFENASELAFALEQVVFKINRAGDELLQVCRQIDREIEEGRTERK